MSQKLRGFVGQGMGGRKSFHDAILQVVGVADATSSTGSITATKPCQALIFLTGPGGSGGAGGGGGGAAVYKRVRLGVGQSISWSVGARGAGTSSSTGNDATPTTVTLPDGTVLVATGGLGGGPSVGGGGGLASGGDINRNGGAGGSVAASGASGGTGGGTGGAGGAGSGGGGGGAGFSDQGAALVGGSGSDSGVSTAAGGNYGGGSGGSSVAGGTGDGGLGRALIWLIRPH